VRAVVALAALLVCGLAEAADPEVFVPAHRTRDGTFVPANVPPNSSAAHLARRPGKVNSPAADGGRVAPARMVAPILAEAQPIRR
jgi:hypothetical protein